MRAIEALERVRRVQGVNLVGLEEQGNENEPRFCCQCSLELNSMLVRNSQCGVVVGELD